MKRDKTGGFTIWYVLRDAQISSLAARREKALRHALLVIDDIKALRARGLSWISIAARLNRGKVTSPRGKQWSDMQVRRTFERYHGISAEIRHSVGEVPEEE